MERDNNSNNEGDNKGDYDNDSAPERRTGSGPVPPAPVTPPSTAFEMFVMVYNAWRNRKAARWAFQEEEFGLDPFFNLEDEGDPEPQHDDFIGLQL